MQNLEIQQTPLGWSYKKNQVHFFFGNQFSSIEVLQKSYPQYKFLSLAQIHSKITVRAQSQIQEADAHFTQTHHEALCIRTADCLPILISDQNTILAVHAGWRGLATHIIQESLKSSSIDTAKAKAFIGPHIHYQQFEVGLEVASEFKRLNYHNAIFDHPNSKKAFIDLKAIAIDQLKMCGLKNTSIWASSECTFLSSSHHSFRRDLERSGRQISFVVKLTI